jgi:hypothetical protein
MRSITNYPQELVLETCKHSCSFIPRFGSQVLVRGGTLWPVFHKMTTWAVELQGFFVSRMLCGCYGLW